MWQTRDLVAYAQRRKAWRVIGNDVTFCPAHMTYHDARYEEGCVMCDIETTITFKDSDTEFLSAGS